MTGGNSEDAPVASATGADAHDQVVQRISGSSYSQEKGTPDADKLIVVEPPVYNQHAEDLAETQGKRAFWNQYRPFILAGVAAVILAWWISSTILKDTRHRWLSHTVIVPVMMLTVFRQDCSNSLRVVLHSVGAN
jgi:CNT family concentrative nucleoside transporter